MDVLEQYAHLSPKELYERAKYALEIDLDMDPVTKRFRLQQLDDYYFLLPKDEHYKLHLLFFIHMYQLKFVYKF